MAKRKGGTAAPAKKPDGSGLKGNKTRTKKMRDNMFAGQWKKAFDKPMPKQKDHRLNIVDRTLHDAAVFKKRSGSGVGDVFLDNVRTRLRNRFGNKGAQGKFSHGGSVDLTSPENKAYLDSMTQKVYTSDKDK